MDSGDGVIGPVVMVLCTTVPYVDKVTRLMYLCPQQSTADSRQSGFEGEGVNHHVDPVLQYLGEVKYDYESARPVRKHNSMSLESPYN